MTELERMLKNTLTTLEQDLSISQKAHGATLDNQQRILETHNQDIRHLQETVSRMKTEQAESARHLQRLSDIHTRLEPLLSRLNALLNTK